MDNSVLEHDGKIRIWWLDASLEDIRQGWEEFESFQVAEDSIAPPGVNKWFHSSALWWWNDTYYSMIRAGLSSLYISITFAFIVILLLSRSVMCAAVSALNIFFILSLSTATFVALGK